MSEGLSERFQSLWDDAVQDDELECEDLQGIEFEVRGPNPENSGGGPPTNTFSAVVRRARENRQDLTIAPPPPPGAVSGNYCDPGEILTSEQIDKKSRDLDSLATQRKRPVPEIGVG